MMPDNETLKRVEVAINSLEKTKAFFVKLIFVFATSIVIFIGNTALDLYRIDKLEDNMCKAASLKGVTLLRESYQAEQRAFINLLDNDYQVAAERFHEDCKRINDNIFFYSMSVTRSANLKGE